MKREDERRTLSRFLHEQRAFGHRQFEFQFVVSSFQLRQTRGVFSLFRFIDRRLTGRFVSAGTGSAGRRGATGGHRHQIFVGVQSHC